MSCDFSAKLISYLSVVNILYNCSCLPMQDVIFGDMSFKANLKYKVCPEMFLKSITASCIEWRTDGGRKGQRKLQSFNVCDKPNKLIRKAGSVLEP